MRWLAAVLAVVAPAAAGAEPVGNAERVAAVARASGMNGQVLFSEGGRVTLERGFGRVTPVVGSPDVIHLDGGFRNATRWRWASVTKQVAAIIAMQEVAAGRLSLDAPVASYLPDWRGATGGGVTLRMLMQHTSGLPDPNDDAKTYMPGEAVNADLAGGFCAGPVRGQPGESFRYNNCDYHVLGAVLERTTGRSFARLVRERIARPAGAARVDMAPAGLPTVPGFAEGKPETALDVAAFGTAGGLNGGARDLWRIDQALLDGKLLPAKAREAMWAGDPRLGYAALGQWVFPARLKGCAAPVRVVERRGAIGGVQVRNILLPDENKILIVFTNRAETDFGEIWQGKGLSFDLLSAAVCGGGA